jgi:outer membrane receptor protein involved in Fe transport
LCKETPHTVFNVEDGVPISAKAAITLGIQNLLNDRYYVTLLNAQGNHFGPGRGLTMGVRFRP